MSIQQLVTTNIIRANATVSGTDFSTVLLITRENLAFNSVTPNEDGTYSITSLSQFLSTDAATLNSQTYRFCSIMFGESPAARRILILENQSSGVTSATLNTLNKNRFFFVALSDLGQDGSSASNYSLDSIAISNWCQLNEKIFAACFTVPLNTPLAIPPTIYVPQSGNTPASGILLNNQTWCMVHNGVTVVGAITYAQNPLINALARVLAFQPYEKSFSYNTIVANLNLVQPNTFSDAERLLLATNFISEYSDSRTNGVPLIVGGTMGLNASLRQSVEEYFGLVALAYENSRSVTNFIVNAQGIVSYSDSTIQSIVSIIQKNLESYGNLGLIDTINPSSSAQSVWASSGKYRYRIEYPTRAQIESTTAGQDNIRNGILTGVNYYLILGGKVIFVTINESVVNTEF